MDRPGGSGNWNLVIDTTGVLTRGKGTFANYNETIKGRAAKVASAIPGGNDVFVVSGTEDLEPGGTIEVQSGTLSVQGDFTQNGGTTTVDASQTLTVSGLYDVQGGFVYLLSGAVLQETGSGVQIDSGGTFFGTGTVQGNVANAGTLDPGDPTVDFGGDPLEITGNYTQSSTGNLKFRAAGAAPGNADGLLIDGAAQIAGTVTLTLVDGYTPASGDAIALISFLGSFSGGFGTYALAGFSPSYYGSPPTQFSAVYP